MASREERRLMRIRGAGTRELASATFGFTIQTAPPQNAQQDTRTCEKSVKPVAHHAVDECKPSNALKRTEEGNKAPTPIKKDVRRRGRPKASSKEPEKRTAPRRVRSAKVARDEKPKNDNELCDEIDPPPGAREPSATRHSVQEVNKAPALTGKAEKKRGRPKALVKEPTKQTRSRNVRSTVVVEQEKPENGDEPTVELKTARGRGKRKLMTPKATDAPLQDELGANKKALENAGGEGSTKDRKPRKGRGKQKLATTKASDAPPKDELGAKEKIIKDDRPESENGLIEDTKTRKARRKRKLLTMTANDAPLEKDIVSQGDEPQTKRPRRTRQPLAPVEEHVAEISYSTRAPEDSDAARTDNIHEKNDAGEIKSARSLAIRRGRSKRDKSNTKDTEVTIQVPVAADVQSPKASTLSVPNYEEAHPGNPQELKRSEIVEPAPRRRGRPPKPKPAQDTAEVSKPKGRGRRTKTDIHIPTTEVTSSKVSDQPTEADDKSRRSKFAKTAAETARKKDTVEAQSDEHIPPLPSTDQTEPTLHHSDTKVDTHTVSKASTKPPAHRKGLADLPADVPSPHSQNINPGSEEPKHKPRQTKKAVDTHETEIKAQPASNSRHAIDLDTHTGPKASTNPPPKHRRGLTDISANIPSPRTQRVGKNPGPQEPKNKATKTKRALEIDVDDAENAPQPSSTSTSRAARKPKAKNAFAKENAGSYLASYPDPKIPASLLLSQRQGAGGVGAGPKLRFRM